MNGFLWMVIDMITIIYHKKFQRRLIEQIKRKHTENNCEYRICENRIELFSKWEIIQFYAVEFLEKYKGAGIIFNVVYYPVLETDNNNLMDTIFVCCRGPSIFLNSGLGCIIPYNEDEMIDKIIR